YVIDDLLRRHEALVPFGRPVAVGAAAGGEIEQQHAHVAGPADLILVVPLERRDEVNARGQGRGARGEGTLLIACHSVTILKRAKLAKIVDILLKVLFEELFAHQSLAAIG